MTVFARTFIAACTAFFALFAHTAAFAAPVYKFKQQWPLAGAGKWDYADIDPIRHRLFVTHGDHVDVLDVATGTMVGTILNTPGVHGVAFAQELKLGFTSNGRGNSVTVFDLDTLATRAQIAVSGTNPDAIIVEPTSHNVYAFNGGSKNVSVIDPPGLKVVSTIKLDGRPEFAVTNQDGKIYFNVEDKAEIDVIDVRTNKVVARWPLTGCDEPSGLAMDQTHQRLFSVCQNNLMTVTDAATGRRVADIVIGRHPDAAAYDAQSATVFSSNGDGTLSIIAQIDADHYAAAVNVPTGQGARTMALDHDSKIVYLPSMVNKVLTVTVVAPQQ